MIRESVFFSQYSSPVGQLLLISDGTYLTHLCPVHLPLHCQKNIHLPLFDTPKEKSSHSLLHTHPNGYTPRLFSSNNASQSYFDLSDLPTTNLPLFSVIKQALNAYFAGMEPKNIHALLHPNGTPFQLWVWQALQKIPYGTLTTYGTLAKCYQEETGKMMSAQAVGGAVGRNPIMIFIPCHRVIGTNGFRQGYAYGASTKKTLLETEGIFLK